MRGLTPRRQTPHPSAMLRIAATLSHRGRGEEKPGRFFPSPLVGEGGALWSALALLSAPDEGSHSAETDPSPVRDAAHRGHPLPQGERGREAGPLLPFSPCGRRWRALERTCAPERAG